ncbi:hypothetical protein BDN70DRAFT_875454 [Pholiota conissans]|uniref:Uncharacterized protein n=1 Tax=Pholiota conissans TaxID=109636 RepID=A0A9P5Z7B2_9AGAR|nr:hypothetical protein BDN70DRAFT_875454 [Pholiota conissans]
MIRREPTLIPMTDVDVQDVRDLVAQQKAEGQRHQALMVKLKRLSENPALSEEEKEILKDLTGVLTPFKTGHPKTAGPEQGSSSKNP